MKPVEVVSRLELVEVDVEAVKIENMPTAKWIILWGKIETYAYILGLCIWLNSYSLVRM